MAGETIPEGVCGGAGWDEEVDDEEEDEEEDDEDDEESPSGLRGR